MKRQLLLLALAALIPFPVAAQVAPQRWLLVPDLRIGSFDDRNYALTAVSDLAIDAPTGAMYVAQRQEGMVRVFMPDGRFVCSFGGRGSGPGEFQSLARRVHYVVTFYCRETRAAGSGAVGLCGLNFLLAAHLPGRKPYPIPSSDEERGGEFYL